MSDLNTPPEKPLEGHRHFYNWISLAGSALFLVGMLSLSLLAIINLLDFAHIAYIEIIYLLFGLAMLGGLGLTMFGALLSMRRQAKGLPPIKFKMITFDLNQARQRNMALGLTSAVIVGMALASMGSYQAVHYMESDNFCINACHEAMHPEGIAYKNTEHANVKCVECHVGGGATSFIAAKINGMRQLYGIATGDYPKPIPTPVHGMRPAEETCEACHWRNRYVGLREKNTYHFLSDEKNTRWRIRNLIKVGGKKRGSEKGDGIHYHMLLETRIQFKTRDPQKQDVVWVKSQHENGVTRMIEYRKEGVEDAELENLPTITMSCLDCHSRPAHQFIQPMETMNDLMDNGQVSSDIPYIKREGVNVLSADYESTVGAMDGISNSLWGFYRGEYGEFVTNHSGDIKQAVASIQEAFKRTVFPEMKVNWRVYPNNIGHRDYPGCFRCHNEDLVSKEGDTIFTTCTKCHIILDQGADGDAESATDFVKGQPFIHPEDKEEFTEYEACSDCHTGGADTYD